MHVLFFVHGMGKHDDDWSNPVRKKLLECYERYNWSNNHSLTDRVVFCPIRYDHLFDEYIDQWEQNLSLINETDVSGSLLPTNFAEWIESLDEEESNFFWTHIADVIVYRFLPLERARIQIEIIRDITQKINTLINETEDVILNYSFLAHSLGTCVIHDCLHKMGTKSWDDEIDNVFKPQHLRFDSIFMLANTSRVLKNDINPATSLSRPRSSDSNANKTYFDKYFNCFHKFDPVTLFWRFKPRGWGEGYDKVELSHFRELNIHSYEHFLDHPKVHIPLLRRLVHYFVVNKQEEKEALQNYKDISPSELDEDAVEMIKERVTELSNGFSEDSGLTEYIKNWIQMRKLIAD